VGGLISLTMTYSQLTTEIELAKELPIVEFKEDKITNQKIEFIQKEIDNLQEQVNQLENKIYKR
jgi:polyhydroxyalkanoate synthesis regulator phasin